MSERVVKSYEIWRKNKIVERSVKQTNHCRGNNSKIR